MSTLNLPDDLEAFLQSGARLEYDVDTVEPGLVGLAPLPELELGVVWINSDESPLEDDDPHAGEDGYYEVPAVSLTNECEAYDPEFILLWLPNEQLFGSWDCDHWDLFVFRDTSWSDIAADPARYVDVQWSDTDREISDYFKPYPQYGFKQGSPF
jgi:hypothetical protein